MKEEELHKIEDGIDAEGQKEDIEQRFAYNFEKIKECVSKYSDIL